VTCILLFGYLIRNPLWLASVSFATFFLKKYQFIFLWYFCFGNLCLVCLISFFNKINKFDKTHSLIYFFVSVRVSSHALVSVYLARTFNLKQVLVRHAFTLVQGIKRKKRVRTFLRIMLLFGKALATKHIHNTLNFGSYICTSTWN